ncbi:MAG: hypothetical protein QOG53_951 [Frankiales bacterium]|jgi:hypothetical protein|nr:hypothetical protein [Frankiales bacterium]
MHFLNRVFYFADYFGDLDDDDVLQRVVEVTIGARTGFDADQIVRRLKQSERTWAAVLDTIMRDFTERQGKERWSEKSPLQSAEALWKLFPNAQVVHIVRHPLHSVASTSAKLAIFRNPVKAAHEWHRFTVKTMAAGERRGPAQYMRVLYEDLAADPQAVMSTVCTFLGEQFESAMVTDIDRRRSAVNEVHLVPLMASVFEPIKSAEVQPFTGVTRLERARVWAVVAPVADQLGYDAPRRPMRNVGRAMNRLVKPLDRLHEWRAQQQASRLTTPDERYASMLSKIDNFMEDTEKKLQR